MKHAPNKKIAARVMHLSSGMRMGKTAGFALPTALAFVVITGVFVGTSMLVSTSQFKAANDVVKTTQAQYAAETGVERAAEAVFTKMLATNVPLPQNRVLRQYRIALLSNDVVPGAGVTVTSTNKRLSANGSQIVLQPTAGTLANGDTFRTTITRVDYRGSKTILQVQSVGTHRDTVQSTNTKDATTRVINRNLVVAPRFSGLDYALLSNQINCSLCHAKIMDMEAQYATSGTSNLALLDNTPVVKIASLRETDMRTNAAGSMFDAPDTLVGGTFYARGAGSPIVNFKDQAQNEITAPVLTSEGQLQFFTRNTTPGSFNKLTSVAPVAAAPQDCSSACSSPANLYLNYPLTGGVDGELVTEFPLPIYDKNQNRSVDNDEWTQAILETVVDEGVYGKLLGGIKQVYLLSSTNNDWEVASSYDTTKTYVDDTGTTVPKKIINYSVVNSAVPITLVDADFNSYAPGTPPMGAKLTAQHGVRGSMILSGTTANPLTVSGSVYVDGDVVISGKIRTSDPLNGPGGKIFARGNIYVVGDLEYDCNGACNYSNADNLPRLVLAAGGNILIGDYISPTGAVNADLLNANLVEPSTRYLFPSSAFSPNPYSAGLAMNPGIPVIPRLFPGDFGYNATTATYMGTAFKNIGGGLVSGSNSLVPSFVVSELANYDRQERDFALATIATDPQYLPRYYKLRNTDPSFFRTTTGSERPTNYSTSELTQLTNSNASYTSLSPTGNWISESAIKQLWINNVELNPTRAIETAPVVTPPTNKDRWDSLRSKPLQIDAILYSANSIFAIARGNTNVNQDGYYSTAGNTKIGKRSVLNARLTINGAVVAADMGLFAAGDAPDGIIKLGSNSNGSFGNNKQRWGSGNNKDGWFGLHINYDRRAADALPLRGSGLISELLRADNTLAPR